MVIETSPLRSPGPKVLFANRAAGRLTGYSRENLQGYALERFIDADGMDDFFYRLPRAASRLGVTFEMRAPLCCADGGRKECSWRLRAVPNSVGVAEHFLISMVELPEVAESSAIRTSEGIGEENSTADEKWSMRPTGAETKEIEGLGESFPEDEGGVALESGEDGCFIEEPFGAPVEDVIDTEGAIPVTVIDDDGDGEEKNVESLHLERSKMESLALVASGIAHDFNNVLTSVIANLSLAKLDSTLGTELREHIDDAASAAENAKHLTEQLLAFARGGRAEKRHRADVGALLRDAVRLSTYGASVRCDLNIASPLWSAEIDATQITQVINNLLINARQAMRDSGVVQANLENVDIANNTPLDIVPGKYLRLKIVDHGCGIPKDNLAKIFDPFFTTKKSGTGLGLATCQSIVRKHGGVIAVESNVGVGTEFSVYLPATGCISEKRADEADRKVYEGEGTVLVVDDQDDVRAVASAMLRRLGYDVVGVRDGEEAVRVYRRRMNEGRPFSCVIMDMTLPGGISGRETVEEIHKYDPFAIAIASSGYFDDHAGDDCAREGFAGVLCKPYDLEQLSLALHKVLRGSEDRD
jgi:nitrogen-specific signal transduction histidine kinase/ActR/RegA family two-component response regulator